MEWTQTLENTGASIRAFDAETGAAAAGWPQSRAAFERLVEAVQDELVRFAYYRLRSLPDAEDVVQDVLVDAYIGREKHRDVEQVRAYLYRMVSNRCTDLQRKQGRAGAPVGDEAAARLAAPPPSDEAESMSRLAWIEATISKLPEQQAEVMRLRIYGGLPFASIAETVGASVPTIKSRFRYGVERLRGMLNPKEAQR